MLNNWQVSWALACCPHGNSVSGRDKASSQNWILSYLNKKILEGKNQQFLLLRKTIAAEHIVQEAGTYDVNEAAYNVQSGELFCFLWANGWFQIESSLNLLHSPTDREESSTSIKDKMFSHFFIYVFQFVPNSINRFTQISKNERVGRATGHARNEMHH